MCIATYNLLHSECPKMARRVLINDFLIKEMRVNAVIKVMERKKKRDRREKTVDICFSARGILAPLT